MSDKQGHKVQLADAMSLMQSSQWARAEHICKQLLEENPTLADANYFLGVIYQNTRQLERAIPYFENVANQILGHSGALNNLGAISESLNDQSKALEYYRQAAAHNPGDLAANYNFGRMLRISGQPREAVTYLTAALELSPDSPQVLHESGLALKSMGKLDEALNHLQRALELSPENPVICNIIGNVFQSQGEIQRAVNSYREAIQLKPDFAAALNNLGSALVARGDIPGALASYRTATRLQPDWSGATSNVLLAQNYISDNDQELLREHLQYARSLERRVRKRADTAIRTPRETIRIGYISPDFRFHSVAYFLKALLSNHDHSRFEIVCFSDVSSPDNMTDELKSLASSWQDIMGLTDAEVFQRIQSCKIDILVDLAGHTANNRLPVFAMQAAPVQVSYLGYPNTTGLSSIQYRITDPWADPPGTTESQYTETLVRLPRCFLCYTPPAVCPEIRRLPADRNDFITYGSFNVLAKISDACVESWSTILRQSPHAKLVLKSAGLQDPATREYIINRFGACGITPDRLELLARTTDFQSHMDLYNKIDISLDTFPYNGTTTTCESFWMGVPVISLAGTRHAGRVGTSLLHQVHLDEYIADNVNEYVSKAILLAENLDQLRDLRSQLRRATASSPLRDAASLTSSLEEQYEKMLVAKP